MSSNHKILNWNPLTNNYKTNFSRWRYSSANIDEAQRTSQHSRERSGSMQARKCQIFIAKLTNTKVDCGVVEQQRGTVEWTKGSELSPRIIWVESRKDDGRVGLPKNRALGEPRNKSGANRPTKVSNSVDWGRTQRCKDEASKAPRRIGAEDVSVFMVVSPQR